MDLLKKIESKQAKLGVIGLGYVGLPLAVEFARAGFGVIGYDVDQKKVAELTQSKFEAQLMVIADHTTPYRLITEILYSCGQAGYANYRLVVLKSRE